MRGREGQLYKCACRRDGLTAVIFRDVLTGAIGVRSVAPTGNSSIESNGARVVPARCDETEVAVGGEGLAVVVFSTWVALTDSPTVDLALGIERAGMGDSGRHLDERALLRRRSLTRIVVTPAMDATVEEHAARMIVREGNLPEGHRRWCEGTRCIGSPAGGLGVGAERTQLIRDPGEGPWPNTVFSIAVRGSRARAARLAARAVVHIARSATGAAVHDCVHGCLAAVGSVHVAVIVARGALGQLTLAAITHSRRVLKDACRARTFVDDCVAVIAQVVADLGRVRVHGGSGIAAVDRPRTWFDIRPPRFAPAHGRRHGAVRGEPVTVLVDVARRQTTLAVLIVMCGPVVSHAAIRSRRVGR